MLYTSTCPGKGGRKSRVISAKELSVCALVVSSCSCLRFSVRRSASKAAPPHRAMLRYLIGRTCRLVGISVRWPEWRPTDKATYLCFIGALTRSWNLKAGGNLFGLGGTG